MAGSFWIETLGCPKNQVDSDKLVGTMLADGLVPADSPEDADVVVVNTCAFVEEARQESIDTILPLDGARAPGARLVVTGCMAERYGDELAEALPEVDSVAGFGVPVTLGRQARRRRAAPSCVPSLDLLNLPRPASTSPWAYVKVAEGCDRACGFCAIPSFRGKQRSRTVADILDEVDALAGPARSCSSPRTSPPSGATRAWASGPSSRWSRPSPPGSTGCACSTCTRPTSPTPLIDAICATGVPYFDLSLQHVSAPLLRRMKRWGDGDRFLERIDAIRAREPDAAFRSNFIVGYPGETEDDHDQLLDFVERGPPRLVRVLRLLRGGRHLRRRPRRPGARGSDARAPRRAPRAAGPHHRGPT